LKRQTPRPSGPPWTAWQTSTLPGGGGFFLGEVAGGWQLRSRPEFNEYIKRMLQPSPQRLTKASLETLAIVAYNQPIIRADIEHIRGVDCGGVLRQLMERKLIRVLGRKEIPGRPMIYATTKLFLELFNLKSLKDLPSPKEMEEFGAPEESPQPQPHAAPWDLSVQPKGSAFKPDGSAGHIPIETAENPPQIERGRLHASKEDASRCPVPHAAPMTPAMLPESGGMRLDIRSRIPSRRHPSIGHLYTVEVTGSNPVPPTTTHSGGWRIANPLFSYIQVAIEINGPEST
jgi:chromosome segregation and condensation protein ScpB